MTAAIMTTGIHGKFWGGLLLVEFMLSELFGVELPSVDVIDSAFAELETVDATDSTSEPTGLAETELVLLEDVEVLVFETEGEDGVLSTTVTGIWNGNA